VLPRAAEYDSGFLGEQQPDFVATTTASKVLSYSSPLSSQPLAFDECSAAQLSFFFFLCGGFDAIFTVQS
jgi:hypothetical protein